MRVLIILNGELKSPEFLKETADKSDFVICADGGYDKAKAAGVIPDVLLGDMDSVENSDFDGEKNIYPVEKDETDCEIAINKAFEMGADEIFLTCAFGGRQDHTLANLTTLLKYHNLSIKEMDVSVFPCTKELLIDDKKDKTVSIIPFENSSVSLKGFKYKGEQLSFETGSSYGMSNIVTENSASIVVHSGKILVFINE